MTLWITLGVMCLFAALFIALPLYRRQQQLSSLIVASVVFVVAVSAGLYARQGSPNLESVAANGGQQSVPDVEEMVIALAARLENNPDDLAGWKMLGRSSMTLQDYVRAADAFERANAIESSSNSQTLVELGEALLARDSARIDGRIAALFENALALEPNNATALFYGGIGALNAGNNFLAADRWETLLGLDPPAEIQQVLIQRIAEWRGESLPTAPAAAAEPASQPAPIENADFIISADISLSAIAAESLPADATVFVIARDPGQPGPPIAVTRRRLSELPDTIQLDDSDSMIPGRSLSGFPQFELVARVSLSGQPVQQSGDWFGAQIVKPEENARITLSIDQRVP